jgi:hypothetical protein
MERADSPHLSVPNKSELIPAVSRKMTPISIAHSVEILTRTISDRSDSAALLIKDAKRDFPNTTFHDVSKQEDRELVIDTDVIIFGLPRELAVPLKKMDSKSTGAIGFPYATTQKIVSFSRASRRVRETLDPEIDFLTDFTDEDGECQPEGLSGGGAWHFPNFPKGELWHPYRGALLGIQIGIYRESKLLRLVRIGAIIELLSREGH